MKEQALPYLDFGTWLRQRLGAPVQKLSVDAGFTCPNRDGMVGTGGCTFCNNQAFTPRYVQPGSTVTQQLQQGKRFFALKHRQQQGQVRYLAYFQSFSNTHGVVQRLRALYQEALAVPGVAGLVIGTRPDCLPPAVLDLLAELSQRTFVLVELGIESCDDATLRRIERGHDFACSQRAAAALHQRGIAVGAHIILGLPGEDERQVLRQVPLVNQLPIDVLKLHQLQVIAGTPLAQQWQRQPFPLFTARQYARLVARYLGLLRPGIALDRFVSQSPPQLVLAPKWGMKPAAWQRLLLQELRGAEPTARSD